MNETILVIREVDKFSKVLTEVGFEVINLPLIQTLPIENFDEFDRKLNKINHYNGLFFTSPKAAEVFLERFRYKNLEFNGKIYVLGNRTKTLFENSNFEIVFVESANTAEDLINSFDTSEFTNKDFLFICGDKSLRTIPKLLKDVAKIDEIAVYRTIENSIDENLFNEINTRFQHQKINCICFFSPSGIESFINKFGKEVLKATKIAVIGITTEKKAVELNLKVAFVATKATAENFAVELIEYLKSE